MGGGVSQINLTHLLSILKHDYFSLTIFCITRYLFIFSLSNQGCQTILKAIFSYYKYSGKGKRSP